MLVLLFFTYKLGFHYYPIQAVIIENRVLHFFGAADNIEIPRESQHIFPVSFPTILNFEMLGMDGEQRRFLLKSEKFEFKDLKIWKFYTPLMKMGYLTKPQFFFYSKERGEIKCAAKEGKLLNRNQNLVMEDNPICWLDDKLRHVSKVDYDHQKKLLEIRFVGSASAKFM